MTETGYTIPEFAPELERGPKWLRELRHFARENFNATPLPPRGLHLWRYTDPAKFVVDRDAIADTAFTDSYDAIERLEKQHLAEGHISCLVTDLGGRRVEVFGTDALTKQGVVVKPLSEAVESHHEIVSQYLYKLIGAKTGKFEALNGALWNDGIFIYVPDGKSVEQPMHLLREAGLANSAQYPRLLVVVGKNAELTLIDEYGGGAPDATSGVAHSNGAVEIFGLQDSRVRYVSLQRQAEGTHSYLTHRASAAQGANMLTIALVFGAAVTKQNFGVIMNGPGAESNMYGVLFGAARQHFDNHTLHHHAVGKTKSNIDFKVVLRDRALSAYTGLIRIDHNAQVCEAYQENRNLLLNPNTRAESIPELEILNEEVTCTHGATVGPIDPMDLFYLKSRGIHHPDAVRMVVTGFIAPTLKLVPADLQERIAKYAAERLEVI
ncbi:MAG: Fe-S cluster assembly protein SufD [bacterium]|nr:Fe-S cluster assembly protein SufD [bacterium]